MDRLFPEEKVIDITNVICFDGIADEFDDSEHTTCRNFDTCTEIFLRHLINHIPLQNKLNYLDVGVGTGKSLTANIEDSLRFIDYLLSISATIDILDISNNMILIAKMKFNNHIEKSIVSSVFNFYPKKNYDLIVAAMCAPYLTERFLKIMYATLKDNGIFLLTYPSGDYIEKTRSSLSETCFKDRYGKIWTSYSFHWNTPELKNTITKIGFNIISHEKISLLYLKNKTTLSPRSKRVLDGHNDCLFCECIIVQKR